MPVRVKICGITNREDAEAAVAAGADALGFILHEESKRFIAMEDAIRIVETLPPFVQAVAVTVNAAREFTNLGWRKRLKRFGAAQLHGQESPAHVRAVSKYLPVIKVFPGDLGTLRSFGIPEQVRVNLDKMKAELTELQGMLGPNPSDLEINAETGLPPDQVRAEMGEVEQILKDSPQFNEGDWLVSAFMLDTPSMEHGGTGRIFDWNLAVEFKKRIAKPLILSGGLNPENVAKAIEAVHPYAVDVSSGVEVSPGRKDHAKLRDFIRICKGF
jgi:phosphoribosylanthranilate isomerase